MSSLNRATILGNLGRDPESRDLPSGQKVTTFSVATTESWTDKNTNQRVEKTEWHRIVVFGKTAENCARFLKKGSKVYVDGRLQTREWEKDEQKRSTTEIVANSVIFLTGREGGGEGGGYAKPYAPSEAEEEIPF